jgi:hypothetical protein
LNRKPSTILQKEWLTTIAETGQPELIPALNHGRIQKNTKYEILSPVYINRKKRPNRDKAPCPMCTKNRFLRGSLVWLYELEVSTVLGRCCADHAEEAERNYRAERLLRWEENFLLEALPHVATKKATVAGLKGFAEELQRVYRKIRNEAPNLHGTLRDLKERSNAQLSLSEEEDEENTRDYVGPAGFRGGSRRGAREVSFGALQGTTMLIRDYKPAVELNDVERNLSVFDFVGDESDALDFIVGLSAKDRKAAVSLLQHADTKFAKFKERAADAVQFFSPANLSNLSKFGSHPLNPQGFSIELKPTKPRWTFNIRSVNGRCRVLLDPCFHDPRLGWTAIPFTPFQKYLDAVK